MQESSNYVQVWQYCSWFYSFSQLKDWKLQDLVSHGAPKRELGEICVVQRENRPLPHVQRGTGRSSWGRELEWALELWLQCCWVSKHGKSSIREAGRAQVQEGAGSWELLAGRAGAKLQVLPVGLGNCSSFIVTISQLQESPLLRGAYCSKPKCHWSFAFVD